MMIDLRSDTVTQPTETMRKVMARAAVGDDVFQDDPTINKLEEKMAEMSGKADALFVPSGTMSNLVALLAHCQRGEEYIVGQDYHTYLYEAGGAPVLGSVVPQPITVEPDGSLDLAKVEAVIKKDDYHFARTKLLCLENTHNGKVISLEYMKQTYDFAQGKGLGVHLDGARAFNATVALGCELKDLAQYSDSISICLSKGLGAPVGSVLCADKDTIKWARRWRKMVGGGMRQAGVLAAAGIYALDHHVERLSKDHAKAKVLAERLSQFDELDVKPELVQTNMVFIKTKLETAKQLADFLAEKGIIIIPSESMRWVMHLDISSDQLDYVCQQVKSFFNSRR
jgi:threonine aldolase